tara:strand:+ start:1689 stop:2195 length:507 start_codon:yes stop_codon:yes gene_type:complete
MSDDPKCWWRYNSNGGRYMTCEKNQKKASNKPPPKVEPKLSPDEFIAKVGKEGYSDLSKAEKNEYHRLDMRERRANLRELVSQNTEEVKKITRKHYAKEAKERKKAREEKLARKKEFSGDRLNEYLQMIKALNSAGNKLPKKKDIKERVGDDKYRKLMKKYENATFKN